MKKTLIHCVHWSIFFCCSNQKRKKPFFDIILVIFSGKKYLLNSWDFQYRKKILAIFPRKLIFFSFDILKIFSFFFWLSFEVWKMLFQKNVIRLKSIKKNGMKGYSMSIFIQFGFYVKKFFTTVEIVSLSLLIISVVYNFHVRFSIKFSLFQLKPTNEPTKKKLIYSKWIFRCERKKHFTENIFSFYIWHPSTNPTNSLCCNKKIRVKKFCSGFLKKNYNGKMISFLCLPLFSLLSRSRKL